MAKDEETLARYRAEEMERDDRRRREEAEWEERCYQAQVAAAEDNAVSERMAILRKLAMTVDLMPCIGAAEKQGLKLLNAGFDTKEGWMSFALMDNGKVFDVRFYDDGYWDFLRVPQADTEATEDAD